MREENFLQNKVLISVLLQTSPPSARVAVIPTLQQHTFKQSNHETPFNNLKILQNSLENVMNLTRNTLETLKNGAKRHMQPLHIKSLVGR